MRARYAVAGLITGFCASAVGAAAAQAGGSVPSATALRPDTRVTSAPARTRSPRPVFRFSSTVAGAAFECKIDRRPFRPCRSGRRLTALRRGGHVLRVRAVAHGLADRTPARVRFRIVGRAVAGRAAPSSGAATFSATILPVTVDAIYAGISGAARLIDGSRRDSIAIHVDNLQPGTTYPWHVHVAVATNPCAPGAPQGPIVSVFAYRALTSTAGGTASATAAATNFTADPAKLYYVNVHDPASGAPIACGVLER